ncbi:hypothetical protein AAMO2058_001336700, partial [Amorphochlora amoebiformis]
MLNFWSILVLVSPTLTQAQLGEPSLVCWGNSGQGGDTSTVANNLTSGIITTSIKSSTEAFALIKQDGSIISWGASAFGGDARAANAARNGVPAVAIYPAKNGFAALLSNGNVVSWGDTDLDGVKIDSFCTKIAGSEDAFGCILLNKTVIAWGNTANGGSVQYIDDAESIHSNNK